MGVGHVAIALGSSGLVPRVNAGWLTFAALLADFLLGIFAALGMEQVHVPPDYASRHYLTFTFPWSHGLVPLLFWSALLGLVCVSQLIPGWIGMPVLFSGLIYALDRSRAREARGVHAT